MKKELHLICNAHIDPVWQWEWEEGAAETLSTFRVAAKFCREFDGFIFCHNEALLYKWVEEYDSALFEEIRELVKCGKWHIMGGWHLQPDCNMPSGEGFVRNILSGREYFREKFGVNPTTAINFDPFGQTRGLVQILAKSGYDSYIFCRPYKSFCKLPSERFTWIGYDGSEITGARVTEGYGSTKGKALEKVKSIMEHFKESESQTEICLWGIGNHGGGPSQKDLNDIAEKMAQWEAEGICVRHSTPEVYFSKLRTSAELPKHDGDINPWSPGCYISQAKVKQKYRQLENELFACEKMCSALALTSDFKYPEKEFGEVIYDLLMIQFHDILPGSSVKAAEKMAIRMADHGLEILSRLRAKAFFRLSKDEKKAIDGEIPIIAYNPHPYPVEDDFECEFVLADQNRSGSFFLPSIYQSETKLLTQTEKEASNIPIDWRKKVTFHAVLAPMQITRFNCKLKELPKKPTFPVKEDSEYYYFENEHLQIDISKKTGLIDRLSLDGKPYLSKNAMSIDVYRDNEDPWGMRVRSWTEKIGEFKLLCEKDGSAFSALKNVIPSVRVIENGEVRTIIEAVFGYGDSKAAIRYIMSKSSAELDMDIHIVNAEKKKLFKLSVPYEMQNATAFAEVAFGEEPFRLNGDENVHQKYVRLEGSDGKKFSVYNKGIYSSSLGENKLLISLMRTPAYCAHPIGDSEILPGNRTSYYIDQGERDFSLRFSFGEKEYSDSIAAQIYNEKTTCLSFFPSGEKTNEKAPIIQLEGGTISLIALKKAEKDDAYVLRLFNPTEKESSCSLTSGVLAIAETISFAPFEVKTFRLSEHSLREWQLTENLME
ncbi:MAG: alpha-mannosidase [Clostridia bacterium]|nr:alpha-mannosidase [Clostridia bacterium]